MFKEGNLVRLITEDGDGEVMRVLEDSAYTTTFVAIGNENGEERFDTEDLELVAESALKQESKEMIPNVNRMKDMELTDEINKYMVAIVTSLRDSGCETRINLRISCYHYSGDDAEIEYSVGIEHENEITSDNLGKSAHIAWSRWLEKQTLKVKAIPFYVEAAE
jgi:hypothetical protein